MQPFLTFLFVGAVDFGRYFYYAQVITSCAENGAMYASNPTGAAQSPYANVTDAAMADALDLQRYQR